MAKPLPPAEQTIPPELLVKYGHLLASESEREALTRLFGEINVLWLNTLAEVGDHLEFTSVRPAVHDVMSSSKAPSCSDADCQEKQPGW
jgi:hypothetical protein